jgi:hypothetical protein
MSGEPTAFQTPIARAGDTLTGPFRSPRQMLATQEHGGGSSVHDEQTAAGLGLEGAPIEGPTHFSQFDPLGTALWGAAWFERGCISAHFEIMVVEGEDVQAFLERRGPSAAMAAARKRSGESVLSGSLTLGDEATALDGRLAQMQAKDPGRLHILDQVEVGWVSPPSDVAITFDEPNGALYPFTLREKLAAITEWSPWYEPGRSPWPHPVLPTEMLSVLTYKDGVQPPVRRPAVGLFIDLEVRRHAPVFVAERYSLTHEVVCVGQSRRVESFWTRSNLVDGRGTTVATVLLHEGYFKESFPGYPS